MRGFAIIVNAVIFYATIIIFSVSAIVLVTLVVKKMMKKDVSKKSLIKTATVIFVALFTFSSTSFLFDYKKVFINKDMAKNLINASELIISHMDSENYDEQSNFYTININNTEFNYTVEKDKSKLDYEYLYEKIQNNDLSLLEKMFASFVVSDGAIVYAEPSVSDRNYDKLPFTWSYSNEIYISTKEYSVNLFFRKTNDSAKALNLFTNQIEKMYTEQPNQSEPIRERFKTTEIVSF